MTFTLEDIKKLCLQYDKEYDDYPESKYEGRSLYSFINQRVNSNTYDENEDYLCKKWEEDMRNVQ